MIAVQKSQTVAVKALCQEFKCDKNAQDMVRMCSLSVHTCMLNLRVCVCFCSTSNMIISSTENMLRQLVRKQKLHKYCSATLVK